MQRLFLCLPAFLLGLPVLVSLILKSSDAQTPKPLESRIKETNTGRPAVVEGAVAARGGPQVELVRAGAPWVTLMASGPLGPLHVLAFLDLKPEEPLPDEAAMLKLAETDPVAFLDQCIRRYEKEVKGYTLKMYKHERIGGKLYDPELIEVHFRERPYSVYFNWLKGSRQAERVLYVQGENNEKLLARPKGFIARKVVGDVVERDLIGAEARSSSRYTLNESGIHKGCERTRDAWKAAKETGALKREYEYLGKQTIKELDDQSCHVLHRKLEKEEDDGIRDVLILVDEETWLQTGSILKDKDGKLIGEYYFRDIQLNEFDESKFKRSALK